MKNVLKKLGIVLTLITAIFMLTGCPKDAPQEAKKYTVTVATFDGANVKSLDFTVEEGDTLESIAALSGISLEGFTFVGFYTADGKEFAKTKPITSDVKLYARFEKKETKKEETVGNVTTKEETIETKTASISTAQTETTTVTTKLADGSETKVIESTTTETKTDNTTVVTEETTNIAADGSSTTIAESTTTDANNNVIAETQVTTTTDAQGNSSTATTNTTYDENGNATSNTDVETTTVADATVESLINSGIKAIQEENILLAKAFFEAAYEKDPNDDQAKVVSALVDLASISTNEKLGKFFKDHLGIQNYPGTLNALLAGDWLSASSYEMENPFYIYTAELEEVKTPKEGEYYYYKASRVWRNKDAELSNGEYTYSSGKLKTIDGKNYIFDEYDERRYEEEINRTEYLSEGIFKNLISYGYSGGTYYCKIDGQGEYLVSAKYSADLPGTFYKAGEYKDYKFMGKTIYIAPTFAAMDKADTWFTTAVKNESYFAELVTANILKGNVNGLDSAIDDLYDALFNSDEYKSAIAKIDSVKADVLVPGSLIEALELEQFYGDGQKVMLGKTELNLVKALLNIYKGIFEYIQSIDLSTDLSFFETEKLFRDSASTEAQSKKNNQEFIEYLTTTFTGYDAKIDPLANKFLSTRSEEKLAASKATFISVIDDLVAAYNSITSESSVYPAMVGENIAKGKVFKDAALLLKTAISDGKVFYVPMEMSDIPAAWPTAAGEGIISIDMKELFGKDLFAIGTYVELCTVNGHAAPALYTITGEDANGDYILTKLSEIEDFEFGEDSFIVIKLDLSRVKKLSNVAAMIPLQGDYIPVTAMAAAYIYNFYYTAK